MAADTPMTSAQAGRIIELLEHLPARIASSIVATDRQRVHHGQEREQLVTLVAAIQAAVGARLFTARDLIAHAALPDLLHLRVAIDAVTAEKQSAARVLGNCLRRIEGVALDRFRIERRGRERDGVVWTVVPTL